MKSEVLRMEHIYVKHKGRNALNDFHINVYKGEVVVVFGYSGSGLHELGNLLDGGEEAGGRLLVDEEEIYFKKYLYPEQYGVYIIHNDHNLVPDLTVAENMFLGPKRMFSMAVSKKKQDLLAERILKKFSLQMDVRQKAWNLLYYQQMMIKMIKAHIKGAKLIVIQEIQEMGSTIERQQIMNIINLLKAEGIAVLWLTQRIEHVRAIADRIVVIREGANVRCFYDKGFSMETLLRAATDSPVEQPVDKLLIPKGRLLFETQHIAGKYIKNISLEIFEKQITGIWSNSGLYLEDIRGILSGEKQACEGHMQLEQQEYRPRSYEEAVKCGIQYIDFMRYENHCVSDMSFVDNQMLSNYWLKGKSFHAVNEKWNKYIENKFKERHPDWPLGQWHLLSADQQRLLLYERCLYQPGKLYMIAEAFNRVNYSMIGEIIRIFSQLLENGKSLVLLSMNYEDLSRVCDQIYIIKNGSLVKTVTGDEIKDLDIWNYVS